MNKIPTDHVSHILEAYLNDKSSQKNLSLIRAETEEHTD